jgi:hypothetical protein
MWRGTVWDLATRPVGLIYLMLSRFLFLIQMPWFTDASGLGEGGGPGGSAGGRIVDGSINYMRDPGDCSLLMHSIYGLNHYPNYLLRLFPSPDVMRSSRELMTLKKRNSLFPWGATARAGLAAVPCQNSL